jgi:hypothetical protein
LAQFIAPERAGGSKKPHLAQSWLANYVNPSIKKIEKIFFFLLSFHFRQDRV